MKRRFLKLATLIVAAVATLGAMRGQDQEKARASGSSDQLPYQLALQRGTQAVIWGMPAVSMMGCRKSAKRDLDATFNDIIYFSKPMVSRHGFLTANNQVPYVIVLLDTTDGPVVLDVPPASPKTIFFGSVIDAWQVPVVDIGPEGQDKGKGESICFCRQATTSHCPRATWSTSQRHTISTWLYARSQSRAARSPKAWSIPSSSRPTH
jgi:hypothetical protein